MPADHIPAKTGQNPTMVRNRLDLAKMAGIWPDLTGSGHWSDRISMYPVTNPATDLTEFGQNGRDPAGIWQRRPDITGFL
jgi:hypothetical protein